MIAESSGHYAKSSSMHPLAKTSCIALIGPMGAGKSTIGKILAQMLSRPFFDSDEAVARVAGMCIKQIFATEGESGFRVREHAAITTVLLPQTQLILATGGGAITHPDTRRLLIEKSFVIYLKVHPEEQLRRLQHNDQRPLIAQQENLGEVLYALQKQREPWYRECANAIFTSDQQSVTTLSHRILAHLQVSKGSKKL